MPFDTRVLAIDLVAVAAALLLVFASIPAAGQEAELFIVDPIGDAGLAGAALPAGMESLDIASVWFEAETPESVELKIERAPGALEAPIGEIAVHFEANGTWWIMGWTTVFFPAPPFMYQGGFFCPATADQVTNPSSCGSVPVSFDGPTLTVTIDRKQFMTDAAGALVTGGSAYADLYNFDGTRVTVDTTPVGGDYVFQTGSPAAGEEAGDGQASGQGGAEAPAGATDENGAYPDGTSQGPGDGDGGPRSPTEEASSAGILLPLTLLGLVVALRRR